MPKSAHSSMQPPNESDFNDSHPAEEVNKPSLGDLSAVESEILTPSAASLQIGDVKNIDDDEEEHNDVLGDITLLEEAFAELEDGNKTAPGNDVEIPVLSEAVEPPSSLSLSQMEKVEENLSESIPVLDQPATVYEEMKRATEDSEAIIPESNNTDAEASTPASKFVSIGTDPSESAISEPLGLDDDLSNLSIDNISEELNALTDDEVASSLASQLDNSEMLQPAEPESTPLSQPAELDTIDSVIDSAIIKQQSALVSEDSEQKNEQAQLASEMPSLTDEDLSMAYEQSLSRFAEDLENEEPDLNELDIDSENSSPEFMDSSFNDSESDSIDAKIAHATGTSGFDVNEIPLNEHSEYESPDYQLSEFSSEDSVSSFAEDLVITEIPELENGTDLDYSELHTPELELEEPPTHAEHSVAITSESGEEANFSLNIPFELHSQLSQKIDNLVIEATTSLTNELHIQLADRMETLLNNSVESVLPRLIDQMASELRNEVKNQVKTQLPNIINDVLGKTRLQK